MLLLPIVLRAERVLAGWDLGTGTPGEERQRERDLPPVLGSLEHPGELTAGRGGGSGSAPHQRAASAGSGSDCGGREGCWGC